MKKTFIFFLVIFFFFTLVGDETESDENKLGWVLFPIVFYSSDTSLGFGASAVLFKDHHKIGSVTKSQSFTTVAFYTLRNQLLNANIGNIYRDKANWHWRGIF